MVANGISWAIGGSRRSPGAGMPSAWEPTQFRGWLPPFRSHVAFNSSEGTGGVDSNMLQHVRRRLNGLFANLFTLIACPQSLQIMEMSPAMVRVLMYMP